MQADEKGDQKVILHKQNAIRANPGRILDEVKRKRAGRMKKVVSVMQSCGNYSKLTRRTSSAGSYLLFQKR